MARFVKGDVVVVPFPFSDLSRAKRRPALVLAAVREGDLILCQITSRAVTDGYAVALDETDFRSGSLPKAQQRPPEPAVHGRRKPRPLSRRTTGRREHRRGY